MPRHHFLLVRASYHDPDVTGMEPWKRQWKLEHASRLNEKKKKEYTEGILNSVAVDWIKNALKSKEGKEYKPDLMKLEVPPQVVTSDPDEDFIPVVKVDGNFELESAQVKPGKKAK